MVNQYVGSGLHAYSMAPPSMLTKYTGSILPTGHLASTAYTNIASNIVNGPTAPPAFAGWNAMEYIDMIYLPSIWAAVVGGVFLGKLTSPQIVADAGSYNWGPTNGIGA